jgi:hypothetical protein
VAARSFSMSRRGACVNDATDKSFHGWQTRDKALFIHLGAFVFILLLVLRLMAAARRMVSDWPFETKKRGVWSYFGTQAFVDFRFCTRRRSIPEDMCLPGGGVGRRRSSDTLFFIHRLNVIHCSGGGPDGRKELRSCAKPAGGSPPTKNKSKMAGHLNASPAHHATFWSV